MSTREKIQWWLLKIRNEKIEDPFYTFFICYQCFDAYITDESKKDSDADKLAWFTNNDNFMKEKWKDGAPNRSNCLSTLKRLSPVLDMRPNSNKEVYLNDEHNINEVVEYIYQIRCNLFHGSKSNMDSRDVELVENSAKILKRWLEWCYMIPR